ncbi:MAG: hypothetical protein M1816_007443 [Peltula sp. TS41687]|nr:MAG: hypothetical protein M1816_007443 [Peltula sp. TS41687]
MRVSLLAVTISLCFSTTLARPTLEVRETGTTPQSGNNEPYDESASNEVGRPAEYTRGTSWEYKQIVDAWLMCYDDCAHKRMDGDGHISAQARLDCGRKCGELGAGGPGLPTPTYDKEKLGPWLERLAGHVEEQIKQIPHRLNFASLTKPKLTMPNHFMMPVGPRFWFSPLK